MILPETIYLHLTRACNLRCEYCYISAGDDVQEIELSTQEIYPILRDVYKLRPQKVVFTGGEPLLRNDLVEIATFFKSLDKENTICLCINSNGTLINSENAVSLTKVFDEIRISIDGFEETNDKLRGQGSFKKAMNAFHEVLMAGGDPVAFITVTSMDISMIKDFMSFLLRKGVFHIHFSELNLTGRALGKSELACDIEEATKTVAEFWYETFGLKLINRTNTNCVNCGVGRFITVYPDGSVYPCHLLSFPELYVGNVRESSLYSLFHCSEFLNKLRESDFCRIAEHNESFQKILKYGTRTCIGRFVQESEVRKEIINAFNGDAPPKPSLPTSISML